MRFHVAVCEPHLVEIGQSLCDVVRDPQHIIDIEPRRSLVEATAPGVAEPDAGQPGFTEHHLLARSLNCTQTGELW